MTMTFLLYFQVEESGQNAKWGGTLRSLLWAMFDDIDDDYALLFFLTCSTSPSNASKQSTNHVTSYPISAYMHPRK
jgi:hypothetical protein